MMLGDPVALIAMLFDVARQHAGIGERICKGLAFTYHHQVKNG
jgi:hypothetical protein